MDEARVSGSLLVAIVLPSHATSIWLNFSAIWSRRFVYGPQWSQVGLDYCLDLVHGVVILLEKE